MTVTDIQADLTAICKLLEARMVACPTCGGSGMSGPSLTCQKCSHGAVPDPQYDALRAVVYGETVSGLRDWSSLPPGALWGALIVALEWTLLKFTAWEQLKELSTDRLDLDLAALQVVREALGMEE